MTPPAEPTGVAADVPAPLRPVGGAMTYRTIVEAVLSAAVLPVSVALAFIVAAHFGTVAALVVALPPALWFVLRIVRSKRRAAFYGLLGLCCAVVATAVVGTGVSAWSRWTRSRAAAPVGTVFVANPGRRPLQVGVLVRVGTSNVFQPVDPSSGVTPPNYGPDVPTPR